jgi:hypothetical protein
VRFAYERLADHLIIQTLLDGARRHDGHAPDALARIVSSLRAGDSVIDALALMLPEQTHLELTDLAEHASEEVRSAMPDRVIQSLPLRDPAAITDQAISLLESALFGTDRPAARRAASVAITLACSSGHRLDHHWLTRTLTALPMYQRDMTWTAAVAGVTRQRSTPYHQLLTWVDAEDSHMLTKLVPESAQAVATTLMWALTSSDRFLRDQATRRLIKLVAIHPDVLIPLLQDATNVDDPYVLERVCAVIYGVALRGLPEPHLHAIAIGLLDLIFKQGDLPPHILIRDYARSTVRLAHQRGLVSDEQWHVAAGPWSSPWPGQHVPSVDELESTYPLFADDAPGPGGSLWASIHLSALSGGDFARYIIGTDTPHSFPFTTRLLAAPDAPTSLPPDEDASSASPASPSFLDQIIDSLPETHPLHRQLTQLVAQIAPSGHEESDEPFDTELVSRFVFLGVVQRGWTPERFQSIDTELDGAQTAGRGSRKRERIGKKYQWQAWHEALARLSRLPEVVSVTRGS